MKNKQLIIGLLTAILILMLSSFTIAQTIGSTKSEVLKRNGAPTQIMNDNIFLYQQEKGVLMTFYFTNNKVEKFGAHRKRTVEQHEAVYVMIKSKRGEPTTSTVMGNVHYMFWVYPKYVYSLTYDTTINVTGIVVFERTQYSEI